MSEWPWYLWILLIAFVAFLLAYLSFMIYQYVKSGVAKYYLGYVIILIFIHIIMGVNDNYATHIHHWFSSLLVLTITCHQHPFITVVAGIFNGVLIEGGARWGFDAPWTLITVEK